MKRLEMVQKIIQLALVRDMSQAELARQVHMQPSHLNHFLKGHGDIRSGKLIEILLVLGLDLEKHIEEHIKKVSEQRGLLSDSETDQWLRIYHTFQTPEREAVGALMKRLEQESLRLQ